jgi:regulator of RNase E activity RraA
LRLGKRLFADSSGPVVIPDGQLEEVIEGARAVQAEDARSREDIQRGQLSRKRGSLWGRGR